MSLTRWDPFEDLLSLQERINRLFEEETARLDEPGSGRSIGTWLPAVDIFETHEQILLRAELPGVDLKDVELEMRGDLLLLRGERQLGREIRGEKYHRVERAYGSFSRSFKLPSSVMQSKIKAKLRDGILEVTLPKAPHSKPREEN